MQRSGHERSQDQEVERARQEVGRLIRQRHDEVQSRTAESLTAKRPNRIDPGCAPRRYEPRRRGNEHDAGRTPTRALGDRSS